MKDLRRREFLKYAGAGIATIVIGCNRGNGNGRGDGNGGVDIPPLDGPSDGVVDTLDFTITDAVKEMITHEPDNPGAGPAECYFWVFKENRFPADSPGPQIFALAGDRIRLRVTNELDGPHAFFIPGMVDTGPIGPGERVEVEFTAGAAGTYLYHDNLNPPVNRVMGLHGALVIMPRAAVAGHKLTPYDNPTPAVQALYDDFGTAPWWPGLSWETGDERNGTPPTRQAIWLLHQASPVLFDEVGAFAQANPGRDFPADQFVNAFVNDPFINTSTDARTGISAQFPVKTPAHNRKPQFFTIDGQSGHFAHNHPFITPMYRVGEPTLVRILNAGLWVHSMHLHANHFYVTAVNNVPQENVLWVDTFNVDPMDHVDYTIPFMRPPSIPDERGIGRADPGLVTVNGTRTWPPLQEFELHNPPLGSVVTGVDGNLVDIAQRQSPLCYPMHDHSEPTQTAQGGNYNNGTIAGIYFLGDRNTPGQMDFPMDEDFRMMVELGGSTSATGAAAGEDPDHEG